MVMEYIFLKMVNDTKESYKKEEKVDKDNIFIQMVIDTSENG